MISPIYTEKTICRDCYKCVRQCPVKAIKVEDGSAVVVHDLCIFCGKCIEVCPANAKKLRNDTSRARQMIGLYDKVIASIAPSFPAEFDCDAQTLIRALKKLGFDGVSETSIGAGIISRKIAEKIENGNQRIISSACPTVVELIRKYKPELTRYISEIVSPLHAHADYMKRIYGEKTRIVFIGPCISKKIEADDENSPIDLALTFKELREWLAHENIELATGSTSGSEDAAFIPEQTSAAAEYAIEGGMLNTIRDGASVIDRGLISCSGITNIIDSFSDIASASESKTPGLFLEFLACEGGCVSGRGMTNPEGYLKRRLRILDYCAGRKTHGQAESSKVPAFPEYAISLEQEILPEPVHSAGFSDGQLSEVLLSLNKTSGEDELNCGGCGYNTCRDFAAALLEEKAEHTMCVTNMRKLAEKKSNALMKALPLGVVITDRDKNIIECNDKFLDLFSDIDPDLKDSARKRAEGVELERFIPGFTLLDSIKTSSLSMIEEKIHLGQKIFRVFVFDIGGEEMTGAVFQDITSPAVRRETIIRKTEEVIEKSLSSVQQIASLLGENAAETQLILNSLIESYNTTEDSNERIY